MKKNLYYSSTLRRENLLKKGFLGFFQHFASYPRLLLEVFIRKDFGERYFQLSSALWVTFLLALWPVLKTKLINPIRHIVHHEGMPRHLGGHSLPHHHAVPEAIPLLPDEMLIPQYLGWYIFLALFLLLSFIRYAEIKRSSSAFDFSRYSLSNGKTNPLFFKIHLPGRKPNIRQVETFIEPAFFFIVGLILWKLLHQSIGIVILVSSIFYSFGYVADYAFGDNYVMDKIDEMIGNQGLEKSFVEGVDDATGGSNRRAAAPAEIETRQKIQPPATEESDIIEAR